MDEREKKLPIWAQELIEDLRQRLNFEQERLARENSILRKRTELLQRRNEALTELLECAALGQHLTAMEIVKILHAYSLTLTTEG